MTGFELIAWIALNHAEKLDVVCEQVNESYPGIGAVRIEKRKVKCSGGIYAKAEDPHYRNWGEEKEVIWIVPE